MLFSEEMQSVSAWVIYNQCLETPKLLWPKKTPTKDSWRRNNIHELIISDCISSHTTDLKCFYYSFYSQKKKSSDPALNLKIAPLSKRALISSASIDLWHISREEEWLRDKTDLDTLKLRSVKHKKMCLTVFWSFIKCNQPENAVTCSIIHKNQPGKRWRTPVPPCGATRVWCFMGRFSLTLFFPQKSYISFSSSSLRTSLYLKLLINPYIVHTWPLQPLFIQHGIIFVNETVW